MATEPRTERELVLHLADQMMLGRWYTWGGDDPSGFDCSGMIVELAKAAGWIGRKLDFTAEGLRSIFPSVPAEEVQPGDLVFWLGRDGKAKHVGLVIDPPTHYMGAEGGHRLVTSLEAAIAANAFIKVRPIASRGRPETRVYGRAPSK